MTVPRTIFGIVTFLAAVAGILTFLFSEDQRCNYFSITCRAPDSEKGGSGAGVASPTPVVFPSSLPPPSEKEIELEFWRSIADSNDIALYEQYLRRYPNGEFAELARAKIQALRGQTAASKPARGPASSGGSAMFPLPRWIPPTTPPSDPPVLGRWYGHYFCAQGRTLVVLDVRESFQSLVGWFSFRAPFGGRGGAGSYEVRVNRSGDAVMLHPVRWLDQPPGYHMVGAELRFVASDRLHGRITDSGCGGIWLARQG